MTSSVRARAWRGLTAISLSLSFSCSAPSEPSRPTNAGGLPASPGSGGASAGGPATPPSLGGGLNVDVENTGELGGGTSSGGASCVTVPVTTEVTRLPVDIVVIIDNSGSMQEEIDAVEHNINVNFANILQARAVDYRLILLSRHEKAKRQTSICVTAPLSANATCPPTPDQPAFTERFYQYSLKVDSLNSLVLAVDTFDGTEKDEFDLAPQGWGAWLRPGASKVFLEVTDDDSDEMSATAFVAAITAKSPQFGTAEAPTFRFHSIVGLGEKPTPTEPWLPEEPLQTSECTGNTGQVENAGTVYQELSRATGGLRFPLCQFTAFDAVFEKIAQDVVGHAAIACELPIPPPPAGKTLDLSTVAVSYQADATALPQTFGQAMSQADCVPNAFYVDGAKSTIVLCPDTCAAAQRGTAPQLNVLFTCESTLLPPPK